MTLLGQQIRLRHLSVYGLIPDTGDYVTYEGSLTQPGCHETVTWILVNRPIYISHSQVRLTARTSKRDRVLVSGGSPWVAGDLNETESTHFKISSSIFRLTLFVLLDCRKAY